MSRRRERDRERDRGGDREGEREKGRERRKHRKRERYGWTEVLTIFQGKRADQGEWIIIHGLDTDRRLIGSQEDRTDN